MNARIVTAILAMTACAAAAWAFEDHFDGGTMDSVWEVVTIGQGPSTIQGGGELQVSIPGNSIGGGSWGNTGAEWISGGCRATCEVVGDFDFSVEFRLVDWPTMNGVRAGIGVLNGVGGADGVVHRMCIGPTEAQVPTDYYVVHSNTGPISIPTVEEAGRLRVVRTESNWKGYYDVGGGWVEIGSVDGPDGPIHPEIRLWCHPENFGGQDVSVAFDNFVLSQGFGCEGVVSREMMSFGNLKAQYR